MEPNELLSLIKSRRSVRKYKSDDIPNDLIDTILEAGRWAPSGLNNQPWTFVIIKDQDIRNKLSELTHYGKIIRSCNTCIAVFYNISDGYDRDKDILGIGACIQNMLLAIESLGLGAVWLGEILKRKNEVNAVLDLSTDQELLAIIALGYPDEKPTKGRKDLNSLIIRRL